MKIGQKIKKMRELRNFTQEFMAEKMNMSQSGYSKIEQDETDIPFSRLNQIAQVLDVNLLDLIGFDDSKLFFNTTANDQAQGVVFQQVLSNNEKNLYESRIADLQKEIERLHNLLERALVK